MGRYSDRIKEIKQSPSYWANLVGMEFADDIHRIMRERRISQAQLAQRLGTSEAYVSKALRGNTNFTLKTMIKLARALDAVLHVHVAEEGAAVRWHLQPAEVTSENIEADFGRPVSHGSITVRASSLALDELESAQAILR